MHHHYSLNTLWTGNTGKGTATVRSYSRAHTATLEGKPQLHLTTDNMAVGEPDKLNPEDLLVTAVASCHLLSYLYVCAQEGIVITAYEDNTTGTMLENEKGGGKFEEIILRPKCTVAEPHMRERALELHHKAHDLCFIANSLNFEVKCEAVVEL
jgi:organic hydroperoxide reductase OsmC/OhrA